MLVTLLLILINAACAIWNLHDGLAFLATINAFVAGMLLGALAMGRARC